MNILHNIGLVLEAVGMAGMFLAFIAAFYSSMRMRSESRATLAQKLLGTWILNRNLTERGIQYRSDTFRRLLWLLIAFAVLAAGFALWQWAPPPLP